MQPPKKLDTSVDLPPEVAAYREALQKDSNDRAVRRLLVEALYAEGQFSEALLVGTPLWTPEPVDGESAWIKGVINDRLGNFHAAIAGYNAARKYPDHSASVEFRLGMIYADYRFPDHNDDNARQHLRAAVASGSAPEAAFMKLAQFESGRRKEAILAKAWEQYPLSSQVAMRFAWNSIESGNRKRAIEILTTASRGIEDPDVNFALVLCLIAEKEYSTALLHLTDGEQSDAIEGWVNELMIAQCKIELGEYSSANTILQRLIDADLGNRLGYAAHFFIIWSAIRQGNLEEADAVFAEVPNDFDLSDSWIDSSYTELFDWSDVANEVLTAMCQSAHRKVAGLAKGLRALSLQHISGSKDDYKKRLDDLVAAIAVSPSSNSLLHAAADLKFQLEEFGGGLEYLMAAQLSTPKQLQYAWSSLSTRELTPQETTRADKLFSSLAGYQREQFAGLGLKPLIEALHEGKSYDAVVRITKCFSIDQLAKAQILFEAAYAFARSSKSEDQRRAREFYERVIEDNPQSQGALNNLALLRESDGRLEEANQLLTRALETDPGHESAKRNIDRIQSALALIAERKQSRLRAPILFAQEEPGVKKILATILDQQTEEGLVYFQWERLAKMLGVRNLDAKERLTELIGKHYVTLTPDNPHEGTACCLTVHPDLTPIILEEQDRLREGDRLARISEDLSANGLDRRFGYNRELLHLLQVVVSPTLRRQLERDLREIVNSLATRSFKAAIVLSGSVAETLLLDRLSTQKSVAVDALRKLASKEGKSLRHTDRDLGRWDLAKLLDVARELNLISDPTFHFGHGIRGYRNLVHPGLEQKGVLEVSPDKADIAWSVVRGLLRELQPERNVPANAI